MKVLVMGGGVVGVAAAYRLLADGHEVSVLDRHSAAAEDTSFGNAGMIAPGHAFAWSSPRAPLMLLRSLWRNDQALRFKLRPDPRLWYWSLLFLGQCTSERSRVNTLRKHRLCVYSQQALQDVVRETGVEYDRVTGGLLYLYRSQATFDAGVEHMQILADDGQEMRVLDRDGVARADPALEPVKDKIAGGVYCPTDESGDCRKFTQALAAHCAERGVRFHYDTTIQRIERDGDRINRVVTDRGEHRADVYVMSLGSQSPILARQVGESLPIYPVKGYSVTLPVGGANNPPTIGAVDEDNLVAYTRMGDRLRVTATAEFAGYDTSHRPEDFRGMLRAVQDLLPNGGDYARPSYWAGLRPMTPEGTPIFGRGRVANLIFNAGQGHMGWTMACGSARITADLVAGRQPEISLEGMTVR